jgi:ferredoxin
MGKKHIARLEPVGIEMEVDEDETILDAAFRQGLMLMHGCKEGQCAACKSFLIEGEVDLDKYSTFALPDFEEQEGYTLLCRAHAMSDVEIELINYDEEILRSGSPVVTAAAEVEVLESLTHDIRRLVLRVQGSEAGADSVWEGESGLITDVVDRLEAVLTEVDAYLCGPPPMVDAAIALLERRGCPESHIYFDKFTTTAA